MNKLTNVVIDKIFNETIYDFISIQVLNLLKISISLKSFAKVFRICLKITNFIAFAQMKTKYHYDRKHHSLFLKIENYDLLRLHREYEILFIKQFNFKFSQQYIGFFKVIERIERLAYKLKLFNH